MKKNEKNNSFSNKNKLNNSINNNNFSPDLNLNQDNNINNNINNNNINLSNSMNYIPYINKKLSYPTQSKPLDIFKRNFNNNKNKENNSFNKNGNIVNIHKLSRDKKEKKCDDLLIKIIGNLTTETLQSKNMKITEKIKNDKNDENKSLSVPSMKSSNSNSNDDAILDVKNDENENSDKKDSNDDEDDILSEQKDEMEMEEGGSNILTINKIESIKVHSNFIPGHHYTGSGFSYNSNNSNSNKSSIKQKCNTEPNNPNLYMNDCPSGRSNNSGNFYIQGRSGGWGYENNYGGYPQTSNFMYHYKSSFLSTNTNSHNQSGRQIDTSYSSESGHSPHYLGNVNAVNNTMYNYPSNNLIYPFRGNTTPIGNKHINTSNYYSNENLYSKQLFSLNVNSRNKNERKFPINLANKKENQVINLDDVASGKETRTTVMIRNIPIKYDTNVLEKELECFEGKYDCLYMPYDYDNKGNKGYAFLNLTNPYHLLLFYEYFNNRCWKYYDSKKICTLNYANFQGIEEIKKHAKNYKGSKKPIFFICTKDDNSNNIIEIPIKYIKTLLKSNPNMKYHEMKNRGTIIVKSFK